MLRACLFSPNWAEINWILELNQFGQPRNWNLEFDPIPVARIRSPGRIPAHRHQIARNHLDPDATRLHHAVHRPPSHRRPQFMQRRFTLPSSTWLLPDATPSPPTPSRCHRWSVQRRLAPPSSTRLLHNTAVPDLSRGSLTPQPHRLLKVCSHATAAMWGDLRASTPSSAATAWEMSSSVPSAS
jgi:hypothetical protein